MSMDQLRADRLAALEKVAASITLPVFPPAESSGPRKVARVLYLPIEVAARELPTKAALAGDMARRGFQVVLGATWNLTAAQRDHLMARYLLPQPRNALADAVRAHASAAMDVSDGLAGDLTKLCRVSGVAASIDASAVPLSDAARAAVAADPAMRETALTGGDDFEVLCTVPEPMVSAFRAAAEATRVPVTDIGVVEAGEGARFMDGGRELTFKRLSFSHF